MKQITFEWEIRDTRDITGPFRTGKSTLLVETRHNKDLINAAIDFCRNIPECDLKRNGIDIERYRDPRWCQYHYITMLFKVIEIK